MGYSELARYVCFGFVDEFCCQITDMCNSLQDGFCNVWFSLAGV